jgi:antitoxin HicB
MRFAFPARFEPAETFDPTERGFVVTFRDLPEAITQGEDEAGASEAAAEALRAVVEVLMQHGRAIPRPSRPKRGERLIELDGLIAAKAALYLALGEAGVSRSELARRLGCDEKEVRRLLDPRHRSRFDRLEAALEALGKRLIVEMRDAA